MGIESSKAQRAFAAAAAETEAKALIEKIQESSGRELSDLQTLAGSEAEAEAKAMADSAIAEAKEGIKEVCVGDFKTIVFYAEATDDIKAVMPVSHTKWMVKKLPNGGYSISENHPDGGFLPGGPEIVDTDTLSDDLRVVLQRPPEEGFPVEESGIPNSDPIENESLAVDSDSDFESIFERDHNELNVTSDELVSDDVLEIGKTHTFTVLSGTGTKTVSTGKITKWEVLEI